MSDRFEKEYLKTLRLRIKLDRQYKKAMDERYNNVGIYLYPIKCECGVIYIDQDNHMKTISHTQFEDSKRYKSQLMSLNVQEFLRSEREKDEEERKLRQKELDEIRSMTDMKEAIVQSLESYQFELSSRVEEESKAVDLKEEISGSVMIKKPRMRCVSRNKIFVVCILFLYVTFLSTFF